MKKIQKRSRLKSGPSSKKPRRSAANLQKFCTSCARRPESNCCCCCCMSAELSCYPPFCCCLESWVLQCTLPQNPALHVAVALARAKSRFSLRCSGRHVHIAAALGVTSSPTCCKCIYKNTPFMMTVATVVNVNCGGKRMNCT